MASHRPSPSLSNTSNNNLTPPRTTTPGHLQQRRMTTGALPPPTTLNLVSRSHVSHSQSKITNLFIHSRNQFMDNVKHNTLLALHLRCETDLCRHLQTPSIQTMTRIGVQIDINQHPPLRLSLNLQPTWPLVSIHSLPLLYRVPQVCSLTQN